jgi:hydroxymethylbilane synthase
MTEAPFVIGTRGSPLALAQASETERRLKEEFPEVFGDGKRKIEIKVIKSTGDMILDKPLEEVGGKGVFTKELDVALINSDVNICVHSMKDVPTELVEGTVLPCNLPREDTRDVWISSEADSPEELPDGAQIGTASLRRQAQLKKLAAAKGKTVICSNFRGNVQTRMMKIFEKPEFVNSTLLAFAGFKRMKEAGRELDDSKISKILSFDEMLPAISQGAIGIQCREADEEALQYLAKLNHPNTKAAVDCERQFLRLLDGNCKTPIAGQAWIDDTDGKMHFRGLVLSADGSRYEKVEKVGDPENPEDIGAQAAKEVKEKIGDTHKFIGEYETAAELGKDTVGEADGLGGYKPK